MELPKNNKEYAALRRKLGTQQTAATQLGIDTRTIKRREARGAKITPEAGLAIVSLIHLTTIGEI
jgi:hypothetical protein